MLRAGKDAYHNYLIKHIKGARFIDLDKDLAEIGEDAAFGGRHPLPSIKKFGETVSRLGISEILILLCMMIKMGQMQLPELGGC